MGRYSGNNSYGFRCRYMEFYGVYYRLSWVVDYYYANSTLRYPRRFSRDTDGKGAKRFCKRHGIEMPEKIQIGQG